MLWMNAYVYGYLWLWVHYLNLCLSIHFMGNTWGNSGNSGWLHFLGSKITADGECSHELKRCLLLGRKVMTNLDSIFKSRDITLPTKVRLVKVMVFPVVMYGCECWTVKKSERQRKGLWVDRHTDLKSAEHIIKTFNYYLSFF